ncbi:MAG: hypothetical protein QOJ68_2369 [Blastococcus sp.]|jgi:hypothetical protein|nr:hypothetical protein [Blastococcus sp.]
MSWLSPRPQLQAAEAVTFDSRATTLRPAGPRKARQRGYQTQVGGWLTVTDRRVVFLPARLDAWLGARTIDVALADITGVRIQISAGLLAVEPALPAVVIEHSGGEALFAVRRTRELMAALRPTSGPGGA